MGSKVIVDPTSVTTYFVAKALVLADQSLADEIVFNIKASTVSDGHGIGTGGYVKPITSFLEETPRIYFVDGRDRTLFGKVPIQEKTPPSIPQKLQKTPRRH